MHGGDNRIYLQNAKSLTIFEDFVVQYRDKDLRSEEKDMDRGL